MNNIFLRSLLVGLGLSAPLVVIAGGIEVIEAAPARVDIPALRPGWGFTLEGSALRGFNNNLNYYIFTNTVMTTEADTEVTDYFNTIKNINPVYSFNLRVGLDYTLAGSANVLKLYYEHLFNRTSVAEFNNFTSEMDGPLLTDIDTTAVGSGEQKLDAASLLSEQHILIGPSWETTILGGVRVARVSQNLEVYNPITEVAHDTPVTVTTATTNSTASMQFVGVGPLLGFGANFNIWRSFGFGAEAQGTVLLGLNKISFDSNLAEVTDSIRFAQTRLETPNIYSVVPELFYRLYGNYFYRFNNGSELLVEAGWRVNQFFNLRTFTDTGAINTGGAFSTRGGTPASNTTDSDDIGFSGPYLLIHYKV